MVTYCITRREKSGKQLVTIEATTHEEVTSLAWIQERINIGVFILNIVPVSTVECASFSHYDVHGLSYRLDILPM